mmetsp:Transcript_3603/g.7882  ORF Transcript_3603/g.7882 Transcript_3603/m.7882 type:complete len:373 (+) Transcript_3603:88-1206(+)
MVNTVDEKTDERTPLVQSVKEATHLAQEPWAPSKGVISFLCFIMIVFSVSLINFNKWLMDYGRFPHAIPLVLIHMIICTVLALMLLKVKPSLFPALTDPDKDIGLDMKFYVTGALPVAIVFMGGLVLGNMVYSHLGMAFVQMIKQSNVVWIYFMSILCGMEQLKRHTFLVILFAIVGTSFTIKGETNFSAVGFFLQVGALCCETARIVIQGILLQGKKLDPLSYVLITSPLSAVLLVIVLCISVPIADKPRDMELPHWSELRQYAPLLVADAILAFCLNVSIALVIKYTSPISYVMCQLAKDVVAVILSVQIGETVAPMQALGFMIQLLCVGMWSLMRSNPAEFEGGFKAGFQALLFGKKQEDAPMATALSA